MVSEALRRYRERQKAKQSFQKDTSVFPFWNIPFGGSATLRLIPWSDPVTSEWYTEKKIVRLKFLDPKDDSKIITFEAPVREMYSVEEKCPILQPVRDLYKEAEQLENAGDTTEAQRLQKVAGAHWIKPIYYSQGFVIKAGFDESEVPENPIRVFPLLKQIYQIVHGKIMSEDEDGFDIMPMGEFSLDDVHALVSGNIPDDEIERILDKFAGYNFILKKVKKGDYANYQTSGWSQSPSMLSDEQLEAIAKHGLHDLRKRLPDQPTDEQYEVMTEMMHVSMGRLLGTHDGYWDPTWETEHGLKPKKTGSQSSGDSGSDDSTPTTSSRGANSASKIRSQLSKSNPTESDGSETRVSDVMSKVMKNRGAKKTEEPVVEAKDSGTETETKPKSTNADLAARIRGGLQRSAG